VHTWPCDRAPLIVLSFCEEGTLSEFLNRFHLSRGSIKPMLSSLHVICWALQHIGSCPITLIDLTGFLFASVSFIESDVKQNYEFLALKIKICGGAEELCFMISGDQWFSFCCSLWKWSNNLCLRFSNTCSLSIPGLYNAGFMGSGLKPFKCCVLIKTFSSSNWTLNKLLNQTVVIHFEAYLVTSLTCWYLMSEVDSILEVLR